MSMVQSYHVKAAFGTDLKKVSEFEFKTYRQRLSCSVTLICGKISRVSFHFWKLKEMVSAEY